jgi:hypothetical protein
METVSELRKRPLLRNKEKNQVFVIPEAYCFLGGRSQLQQTRKRTPRGRTSSGADQSLLPHASSYMAYYAATARKQKLFGDDIDYSQRRI